MKALVRQLLINALVLWVNLVPFFLCDVLSVRSGALPGSVLFLFVFIVHNWKISGP